MVPHFSGFIVCSCFHGGGLGKGEPGEFLTPRVKVLARELEMRV
jgi:hypothetical protein